MISNNITEEELAIQEITTALEEYRDQLWKLTEKLHSHPAIDEDDKDLQDFEKSDQRMKAAKENMLRIRMEIRKGKR